ncbi:hypothetical protein PCE1_003780 [Barthelona sp. PCE]
MFGETTCESLHNHTTASDGKNTYDEMLSYRKRDGTPLRCIAFTDHDTLMPVDQVERLKLDLHAPTKFISGVELSVSAQIHVVGLFIDPNNEQLVDHCTRYCKHRIRRAEIITQHFVDLGFQADVNELWEKIVEPDVPVGRPHILRMLHLDQNDPKGIHNRAIHKQLLDRVKQDRSERGIHFWNELKTEPLLRQPYRLYLSGDEENAYFPYHVPDPERINVAEATELIHGAGGISVLAHPFTFLNPKTLNTFYEEAHLVDAIETDIIWKKNTYANIVRQYCERHSIPISGGADAHSVEALHACVTENVLPGLLRLLKWEQVERSSNIPRKWFDIANGQ